LHAVVIETLDQRRMLSAALDGAGLLSVAGTPLNDRIVLSVNPDDTTKLLVRVNKHVDSFDLSAVKSVRIESGAGNDRIIVDESVAAISVPVTVFAGTGNDRVSTGSGDDSIDGGAGNDRIVSGDGNDAVRGRRGNDRLNGEAGEDNLDGDEGNDRVNGGGDDDVLTGDSGNDHLNGDDGNDDAFGGSGNDAIDGGVGDDAMYGGPQNDDLNGDDGNDALDGGSGEDSCAGGVGDDAFENEQEKEDRDGDDHRELLTLDDVPAEVKAAFTSGYAGARLIKIEKEEEDSGDVYKFKFFLDGKLNDAKFDATGALISNKTHGEHNQVTFDQLPQAVRDSFLSNFTGATLTRIKVDDEGDATVYEFKFLVGDVKHEATLDAAGNVLKHESDAD
jgi:Ca2+-binding RTX toxin-like protein